MKIQVLVSTLNEGIENVTIQPYIDSYLIIHQVTDGKGEDYHSYFNRVLVGKNVHYIQMYEKGLSKSRNFAIKNSDDSADFLWIMDDDVKVLPHSADTIRQGFADTSCDILVVSHSHEFKKRQLSRHKLNLINSAGVASIDICMRKKSIYNVVKFDECFGLGTDLPSGEEYIFITDAIKSGLKVIKQNEICSLHPFEASGNDFYSTYERVDAKHKMMKRIFNGFGTVFFVVFFFKKSHFLYSKSKLSLFLKYAYKSVFKS